VKFLVDNALSPQVARRLSAAGHDAAHVRDFGLQAAEDEVILSQALADNRIVLSADTDFGTILALRQAREPSVILLRQERNRRPEQQALLILANLPAIAEMLEEGCVAVLTETRIRVRLLPIGDDKRSK
jgi:predicted nuclease of predicted toxin-antitoxin system